MKWSAEALLQPEHLLVTPVTVKGVAGYRFNW